MSESEEKIAVNVNIDIAPLSITAIVENMKKIAGRDEKGIYRIDTADKVSETISRFIQEKDFQSYVEDINNY